VLSARRLGSAQFGSRCDNVGMSMTLRLTEELA
jgi:hypothetical protein